MAFSYWRERGVRHGTNYIYKENEGKLGNVWLSMPRNMPVAGWTSFLFKANRRSLKYLLRRNS